MGIKNSQLYFSQSTHSKEVQTKQNDWLPNKQNCPHKNKTHKLIEKINICFKKIFRHFLLTTFLIIWNSDQAVTVLSKCKEILECLQRREWQKEKNKFFWLCKDQNLRLMNLVSLMILLFRDFLHPKLLFVLFLHTLSNYFAFDASLQWKIILLLFKLLILLICH